VTIHALLVDDDADTRAAVALALGLDPRFAAEAVSRFEAVEALRQAGDSIDVLLLDMKPADMSANALVATMRQWSARPIPILLLTANANDPRVWRSAGAQGAIAKPLDPMTLPDRIAEMLAAVA